MDLLDVRGVGPSTKERLGWAGIRTAEELARVRDVLIVSEWSGIPPARLDALVDAAIKATSPRPPQEALRSVWSATVRFAGTVADSLSFGRREST